jgi:hypothetical protein
MGVRLRPGVEQFAFELVMVSFGFALSSRMTELQENCWPVVDVSSEQHILSS